MILMSLGGCLIGGAIKGWLDNLTKPVVRPVREHTPVYS